jgi:hypothetical protein
MLVYLYMQVIHIIYSISQSNVHVIPTNIHY